MPKNNNQDKAYHDYFEEQQALLRDVQTTFCLDDEPENFITETSEREPFVHIFDTLDESIEAKQPTQNELLSRCHGMLDSIKEKRPDHYSNMNFATGNFEKGGRVNFIMGDTIIKLRATSGKRPIFIFTKNCDPYSNHVAQILIDHVTKDVYLLTKNAEGNEYAIMLNEFCAAFNANPDWDVDDERDYCKVIRYDRATRTMDYYNFVPDIKNGRSIPCDEAEMFMALIQSVSEQVAESASADTKKEDASTKNITSDESEK